MTLATPALSSTLYDTLRRIVQDELRQVRTAELAVVQDQHSHASASDQDNYACTVELRDSGLVLKNVPVATGRIGVASIPAIGELVLVQFIGGDVNAPVITGRLYNDADRPPVNDDGQLIAHLPLSAGDSDAVHLEVQTGQQRQIVLKVGNALAATLQDDDPVISLDVGGGKATIKVARDGAVTIESTADLELKGNNVKIKADAQLDLEGGAQTSLKGQVVNIN